MRTKEEIERNIKSLTEYMDQLDIETKHEAEISIDTMLYCLNKNPRYYPEKFPEGVTIVKGSIEKHRKRST